MVEIIVDEEKCIGCGNCVVSCPINSKNPETAAGKPQYDNAVSCIIDGVVKFLDKEKCIGCSICVKSCPFGAIKIVK